MCEKFERACPWTRDATSVKRDRQGRDRSRSAEGYLAGAAIPAARCCRGCSCCTPASSEPAPTADLQLLAVVRWEQSGAATGCCRCACWHGKAIRCQDAQHGKQPDTDGSARRAVRARCVCICCASRLLLHGMWSAAVGLHAEGAASVLLASSCCVCPRRGRSACRECDCEAPWLLERGRRCFCVIHAPPMPSAGADPRRFCTHCSRAADHASDNQDRRREACGRKRAPGQSLCARPRLAKI
jgi:hypothetical protein